ncbi:DUF5412 family protein [Metabacillus flavus]|uniref:DUF5412 family protein n=1 Tax=Metabacillus flavus TaxID=2823519 RepID=UPI00201673B3|nr:DUF5412 family protein [Metabacillus flavus]
MLFCLLFITTVLLIILFLFNLTLSITKKKPFPQKWLGAALTGAVLVAGVILYQTYFFTFNKIDRQAMQKGPGPISSPSETYTANAFYELYGGAAGGVNVWVEITENNEAGNIKTIYYSDAKDDFSMNWIDEDTLHIVNNNPESPDSDRSIKLDVNKEIYDENGRACHSLVMKDEYVKCYQD